MTELDMFAPVMMPGVALLILSTTMRLGNARMAILDLSKTLGGKASETAAHQLLAKRVMLLGQGLQLLYLALIILTLGSLILFISSQWLGQLPVLSTIVVSVGFLLIVVALIQLYLESRVAAKTVLASADALSKSV